MTVVLGGGISGLSAAFYACERRLGQPVLIEASERLGGWIRSLKTSDGTTFEVGPRTIRPHGPQGQNTLRLMHRLNLNDKIVPVTFIHPAARNRIIYANEKLELLPNTVDRLFKTSPPFDRPLIKVISTDLSSPKVSSEDESLYSFCERRFGKDVAEYLISPMLCGICAGDAKQISVKLLMKNFFEFEQKHGSVVKGYLIERVKRIFRKKDKSAKAESDKMENSNKAYLNTLRESKHWAMWALEGGLEQLPKRLAEELNSLGAEVRLNEKCNEITFHEGRIELRINDETRTCSRLISSLSAKSLAPLLERQHPQLARELSAIPCVTVAVVNLEFPGEHLPCDAFGFLVPPKEKLPILGVIFDSSIFPKKNSTVLTVMMGGAWFNEYFGSSPSEEYLLKVALDQLAKILGITVAPTSKNVAILKDCIAQHVVGHEQRIRRIRDYISAHGLPLGLCGSSYEGIGVNDVILSAKQAVCHIDERERSR